MHAQFERVCMCVHNTVTAQPVQNTHPGCIDMLRPASEITTKETTTTTMK